MPALPYANPRPSRGRTASQASGVRGANIVTYGFQPILTVRRADECRDDGIGFRFDRFQIIQEPIAGVT
jgi:hypothetical protein